MGKMYKMNLLISEKYKLSREEKYNENVYIPEKVHERIGVRKLPPIIQCCRCKNDFDRKLLIPVPYTCKSRRPNGNIRHGNNYYCKTCNEKRLKNIEGKI
jgi:hypothetical protein